MVDFLCPDDATYARLLTLATGGARGGGHTSAHSSSSAAAAAAAASAPVNTIKKIYNPIFQLFLQAAADKASKPTLETCVTLTALSAAVVLAGSGDLDTLTLLRMLRNKLDDTTYGTHLGE